MPNSVTNLQLKKGPRDPRRCHFWLMRLGLRLVATGFAIGSLGLSVAAAELEIQTLTLNQAVAQGLKGNLDLLAAHLSISQSEADALTAGYFNNPSVLIDTVFQPFSSNNWDQTNAGGPKQYDLIFSYPFDFSGKRVAAQKSAKQSVKVAEAAFQDAVRLKVRDIRIAYFDVLAATKQVSLAHEKEARLHHLVDVLERRIGQKKILPLLLLRAQLARDQAKLDAEQRQIALHAAQTNLLLLLGLPEGTEFNPSTELRDFQLMKDIDTVADKNHLTEQAFEQRPDLVVLKLTMQKSGLDRSLAEAQVWDNFAVTAGVSSQGPTAGNANAGALGQAYSFNMGMTIPLPTFNRNQGNVMKASLQEEQAGKQMKALQHSITQEIGALAEQLTVGRHLIEAYEGKQLRQARDVRDAQSRLFGTGSSALLDYFDGINAYVTVYSSYYDAVAEYRRNLVRLAAALGKEPL